MHVTPRSRRRGYSLLEIVVVIANLVVLFAIIVPPMYHFIQ